MPKVNEQWTVLPHSRLIEVDQDILTVTGTIRLPMVDLPRRMTVARLSGKRLIIFSAIALNPGSMRVLEAFGQPAFLVVPSSRHRIDAKAWKERYPDMQVVAPEGARRKVEEVVHVDTTDPRFDDPNVQFITVPGTSRREAALLIHSANGSTLVLNDVVSNLRTTPGLGGWLLDLMNYSGDEPQVPLPVEWALISDRPALRAGFLHWAALPSLKRILVSHGEPIDIEPAEALRDFAQSMGMDQPLPRSNQGVESHRHRPENRRQ
jgi:hypothetical protein